MVSRKVMGLMVVSFVVAATTTALNAAPIDGKAGRGNHEVATVEQAEEAINAVALDVCKDDESAAYSYGVSPDSVDNQATYLGVFRCQGSSSIGQEVSAIYDVMIKRDGGYVAYMVPVRFQSIH